MPAGLLVTEMVQAPHVVAVGLAPLSNKDVRHCEFAIEVARSLFTALSCDR
jgi:hypothetical protein